MRLLLVLLSLCGAASAVAQSAPSPPAAPRPRVSPSPLGTPSPGQMRFRGMDKDNDGKISRDEWRGNDKSFEKRDRNGDGVLSGDEVLPAVMPSPAAPTPRPSPSPRS